MKIPEMMKRRIFSYIEAKRGAMLLIAALFNFSHAYLSAQPSSVIDSLEQVLKTVPEDTSKVKLLNNIANELRNERNMKSQYCMETRLCHSPGNWGIKKAALMHTEISAMLRTNLIIIQKQIRTSLQD